MPQTRMRSAGSPTFASSSRAARTTGPEGRNPPFLRHVHPRCRRRAPDAPDLCMIAHIRGGGVAITARVRRTAPWRSACARYASFRRVLGGPVRIALVFPGQGSQAVGMAGPCAMALPAEVFRQADQALGEPLSALIADGPAERLDQTENCQPAILADVHRVYRAWTDRGRGRGAARSRLLRRPLHGPVQRDGRRRRARPRRRHAPRARCGAG